MKRKEYLKDWGSILPLVPSASQYKSSNVELIMAKLVDRGEELMHIAFIFEISKANAIAFIKLPHMIGHGVTLGIAINLL